VLSSWNKIQNLIFKNVYTSIDYISDVLFRFLNKLTNVFSIFQDNTKSRWILHFFGHQTPHQIFISLHGFKELVQTGLQWEVTYHIPVGTKELIYITRSQLLFRKLEWACSAHESLPFLRTDNVHTQLTNGLYVRDHPFLFVTYT